MQLHLKKPLFFFDLETTGINVVTDRIVEICYLRISPSGEEMCKSMRINPGMPIPATATAIHHITNEDVAQCPTFKEVAHQIATDMTGCDLAGFNSNRFDVPLLVEELLRAGVNMDISRHKLVDVQTIFHKMEQRTLSAAYIFYCGKELDGAHSAEADTRATYEVLKAQLDRYADLPKEVEGLAEFCVQTRNVDFAGRIIYDDNDIEVFNFGKYKGQPVKNIFNTDLGYYNWMMQGDFTLNTKNVITNIRLRNLTHK